MSKTCKYFGKCGGCQTPNLSYEEQLSLKMAKAIRLLGRFCHVDEIVPMEDPYHYRCKVQTAFTRQGKELLAGVYQSATGRVIPAKSCLLEDPAATHIRNTAVKLAREMHLTVYSPQNGRGLLRHILVRVSRKRDRLSSSLSPAKPLFRRQGPIRRHWWPLARRWFPWYIT